MEPHPWLVWLISTQFKGAVSESLPPCGCSSMIQFMEVNLTVTVCKLHGCISNPLFDISLLLAPHRSCSALPSCMPSQSSHFCFEEQQLRSKEGSVRTHWQGYTRAACTEVLLANTSPCWILGLDISWLDAAAYPTDLIYHNNTVVS